MEIKLTKIRRRHAGLLLAEGALSKGLLEVIRVQIPPSAILLPDQGYVMLLCLGRHLGGLGLGRL